MAIEEEAKVPRLLLEHWDVIGVRDVDEQPENEYLYEATELLGLLRRGADREELREYLSNSCRALGAHGSSSRDKHMAKVLLDWYAEST